MKHLIFSFLAFTSLSVFACDESKQFSYCKDEKVINVNGILGTIFSEVSDGEVYVSYQGYRPRKWEISKLAVVKGKSSRNSKMVVGTKVIQGHGVEGTIAAIFPDGDIAFRRYDSGDYYKWPVEFLALREGCTTDEFCVGDMVITDTLREVEIVGVFTKFEGVNNRVVVRSKKGNNSIWQTSDLSKI